MTDVRVPIVNTHVHMPPNFSAFGTLADVIDAATQEGVKALGISNFYDQQVYADFAALAQSSGIVPLFGLEFITLVPELAAAGVRVNDPANPGRMYLCGKGIDPFRERSAVAAATAVAIRTGNDARAAQMIDQLTAHFAKAGMDTGLTAQTISWRVAQRGGVPTSYVSLQERHVAQAYQEALSALPHAERAEVLERAYGTPSKVDIDDPGALQAEIRSRLIKAGTPGFVAEVPLGFDEARRYVLEMGGIPTYPTLADGVSPVCPFEADPDALAAELLARGIHAAELIPARNASAVVDAYVAAFTSAGIIVMAGTEHNTADRIPLEVAAKDGPVSDTARQEFWRATCIVAAHAARIGRGEDGYVDADGVLVGDPSHRDSLAAEGAAIITGEK